MSRDKPEASPAVPRAPQRDEAQASQLLAYALGTLEPAAAEEVERRLMASQEVLAAYLAIKRGLSSHIEQPTEGPSARARARLREAVARRYAPGLPRRLWRWLQRPIPLYKSLAFAGVGAVVAVALWLWWPQAPAPDTQSPMIDSASYGAEQLRWS